MKRVEPCRVAGEYVPVEFEGCDICQAAVGGTWVLLPSGAGFLHYCDACAWMVDQYGAQAVSTLLATAPDRRAYFTEGLEWMLHPPTGEGWYE